MTPPGRSWSRREFVAGASSCAAHMGLMSAAVPVEALRRFAMQERFPVAARAPWGRLERVAEGVWALVSTPLEDRTTLCNGGIIAGRAGVVVVEAFGSDAGAAWMAEQAQELTGRRPTHVVLTHYHGDHTAGLRGMAGEERDRVGGAVGAGGGRGAIGARGPEILVTGATRDLALERNDGAAEALLAGATAPDTRRPTEIDLGDRSILVVPRRGHTPSDVTVEVVDPSIVFAGDLVWNGMFPNYVDAAPSRLSMAVRLLRERGADLYVPGHGALADRAAMERYIALLDDVERAARDAAAEGMSAEEAGARYRIPRELGEWMLFNPRYFERAIGAWMGELERRDDIPDAAAAAAAAAAPTTADATPAAPIRRR